VATVLVVLAQLVKEGRIKSALVERWFVPPAAAFKQYIDEQAAWRRGETAPDGSTNQSSSKANTDEP